MGELERGRELDREEIKSRTAYMHRGPHTHGHGFVGKRERWERDKSKWSRKDEHSFHSIDVQ